MKSVADHSSVVLKAREKWGDIDALLGGVKSMRAAGEDYLPKEKAERDDEYKARLKRSWLFNGLEKTVEDMSGKVFTKPVTLGDDVPDEISNETDGYHKNIDLANRDINNFAYDVFKDGLGKGVSYIFVDMPPPLRREDGQPVTRADEIRANIRPYMNHIKACDVLGWKFLNVTNVPTLVQFRFMEYVEENNPDDEFKLLSIEQVRVLDLVEGSVRWRVFRKSSREKEWQVHDEGISTISEIPVVPFYANRSGTFVGDPPLMKLAELNIAHWQSSSDQRNILHVARVPFLFGKGFPVDEKGQLQVSVSRFTLISSPEADLKWVEHTGSSIKSGAEDLKDLEHQMQVMGLELLVPRPGSETATGRSIDQAKMNSPLGMMADNLKDALITAFGFMMMYLGQSKESGGTVEVNKDFGVSLRDAADISWLMSMVDKGLISIQTFWKEVKRRGVLMDDFDYESEQELIKEESGFIDENDDTRMNA